MHYSGYQYTKWKRKIFNNWYKTLCSNCNFNAKLLEKLKSGFKRTISWNKHQSKKWIEIPNQYLDYLIDPSFQDVSKVFVLSFEDEAQWTSYKRYHLPNVEIKYYNAMIDGQKVFD